MTEQKRTAPIVGGYISSYDNPFQHDGWEVVSSKQAVEVAQAMRKSMTDLTHQRRTKHGTVVTASGNQILLQRGTSYITIQADEIAELMNDLRVLSSQLSQVAPGNATNTFR